MLFDVKVQSRPKPRGGSTLSSFDRSSSQIARSASTPLNARRPGYRTHFHLHPASSRARPRGLRTLGPRAMVELGATGGARRDRCRHREVRNAGRSHDERFASCLGGTLTPGLGRFEIRTASSLNNNNIIIGNYDNTMEDSSGSPKRQTVAIDRVDKAAPSR